MEGRLIRTIQRNKVAMIEVAGEVDSVVITEKEVEGHQEDMKGGDHTQDRDRVQEVVIDQIADVADRDHDHVVIVAQYHDRQEDRDLQDAP